jgi:alkyldihydroxyacetonephosphate synthase
VHGVEHGLEVMCALLHDGFAPSVLRLYDEFDSLVAKSKVETETERPAQSSALLKALKRRSLAAALSQPGLLAFAVDRLPEKCTLIVGCEGRERVSERMMEAMRARSVHLGAVDLGPEPGQAWFRGRYHVSYKQSPVFLIGAYVDTMEVSAPWERVPAVYAAVRAALRPLAFVMAHFSHAYLDGCAVYFTFAGRSPEDEVDHYRRTLRAALSAAVAAGGAVSHHHGIGLAKREYLAAHHGPLWREFATLKRRFDPDDIFNRGKWQ